jgi:hypothetical protein
MSELHPIDRAIAAHAKWKSHLRQAIDTGMSEWTVERVRPDVLCEFGSWLHNLPISERMTEHFRVVRDLHAKFHQEAADVLDLALSGSRDKATAAMAIGSPFATVSSKLTAAMTAWKKALPGH